MIRFEEEYLCKCNKNISLDPVKRELVFYKSLLNDLKRKKQDSLDEPKLKFPSEGRQMFTRWKWSYPKPLAVKSRTFSIKYEKSLSTIEKLLLQNFQKKYLYHAFDDILESLKSKPREQKNLLSILYATIISLQNNSLIDFFDIWIDEIYIHKLLKKNKFITDSSLNSNSYTYITIKLVFNKRALPKKPEIFW